MPINDLQILPCFSLEPNKLVSYNRVFRRNVDLSNNPDTLQTKEKKANRFLESIKSKTIKRDNHNFVISDNAYRTLKRRISWLYYLSKSRYKKTYSGKEIYNFKIAFITLSLPSKQQTPTNEVTKNLFNQFLTEIRQRTTMQNYVWRLEFQKNGNVHYHIVTDTYLDYFFALKIWNRILKNNGYIKPYSDKFGAMSLMQYNHATNRDGATDFSIVAKRYAKGCESKWTQPNTVDVRSVISNKAIANYISKYFAKDSDNGVIKNDLDNDSNSANMRLWFCSRSLSKMNTLSNFCEAVEYDIFSIVASDSQCKRIFHKYVTVYYFNIKNFCTFCRKEIEMLLRAYSHDQGYIPAI